MYDSFTDYIILGYNTSSGYRTSFGAEVPQHGITSGPLSHNIALVKFALQPLQTLSLHKPYHVNLQEPVEKKIIQHCITEDLIASAQGAKPLRGHRISPAITWNPTWLWFKMINQARFYWKLSLANLSLASCLQGAALSMCLQVSWQIFCSTLVSHSYCSWSSPLWSYMSWWDKVETLRHSLSLSNVIDKGLFWCQIVPYLFLLSKTLCKKSPHKFPRRCLQNRQLWREVAKGTFHFFFSSKQSKLKHIVHKNKQHQAIYFLQYFDMLQWGRIHTS